MNAGKHLLNLAVVLAAFACKKDTSIVQPSSDPGNMTVQFENVVNGETLVMNTKNYVTQNNDTFKVEHYKYYISNIKLVKEDNSFYTEPDSYHLLNAADPASLKLNLKDVPAGKYKSIDFMLGVDSLRCCSGAQMGDLDPAKGMFWDWDTGYIMAFFGGVSPQSGSGDKKVIFQTIGFYGENNVIKHISLTFGKNVLLSSTSPATVKINSEISEWFKSPHVINFQTTYLAATPFATSVKLIADNYADMFSLKSVEN